MKAKEMTARERLARDLRAMSVVTAHLRGETIKPFSRLPKGGKDLYLKWADITLMHLEELGYTCQPEPPEEADLISKLLERGWRPPEEAGVGD